MAKLTAFEDIWAMMPEEERWRVDELTKALKAEMEFWASLPETERNKRLEKPKVAYDATTDTLWLKNGRPMARPYELAEGRMTVFFEAEIWYPSAVSVSGALELFSQIFAPDDAPLPESLDVRYGEDGKVEKFLNLGELEIHHINLSDYLWMGNGEQPTEGSEIAEDLIVSYGEDDTTPVGVAFFKAAELITPVLAAAHASAPPRLV